MRKFSLWVLPIALAFVASSASAQVLVRDSFNYPLGTDLTVANASYTTNSGTGTPINVVSGLSLTGITGTAGNAIEFTHGSGSRVDLGRDLSPSLADGESVYASVLFRVSAVTGAGDYSFNFGSTGAGTDFRTRVFIRLGTAGNFNLGLSQGGAATTYGADNIPFGSTIFLVFSLDRVAGATNDVSRLWYTADPVGSPLPGSATSPYITATNSTAVADITTPIRLSFRQGSTGTATVVVDELRIGKNWSEVTSGLVPVTMSGFSIE